MENDGDITKHLGLCIFLGYISCLPEEWIIKQKRMRLEQRESQRKKKKLEKVIMHWHPLAFQLKGTLKKGTQEKNHLNAPSALPALIVKDVWRCMWTQFTLKVGWNSCVISVNTHQNTKVILISIWSRSMRVGCSHVFTVMQNQILNSTSKST